LDDFGYGIASPGQNYYICKRRRGSYKERVLRIKNYFLRFCIFLNLALVVFSGVSCRKGDNVSPPPDKNIIQEVLADKDEVPFKPVVMVLNMEEGKDIILNSYLNPAFREWTLAFFQKKTGSLDVAAVILSNAAETGIPPALAFALCYEESRYNPAAINHNQNGTVDRGLFQLNSATFPKLKTQDFYILEVNARQGLSHLAWCLKNAGTDVAGLAMYNAGHNRVRTAGTPKSTLDYVSRILKQQRAIEDRFMHEYISMVNAEITEEPKKASFRFSLLMPLGGH